MNDIIYIVEKDIIESKVFLIYKPLWEEILGNKSSKLYCKDIKDKSNIISTIEENGFLLKENKIIDNIPNSTFTYLFINESLKKNENIKQIKFNTNQDYKELSLKDADVIISIFSISELTNRPKILNGDFLTRYLFLEPIYNRLPDTEYEKTNKFLFLYSNENKRKTNVVNIVYKLINELYEEKPINYTIKDVILKKIKYQEHQNWICDSTCPSINQLLQEMALDAGSQFIFLNEYASCNISRNDDQENSLTNGKSNSLRSRIKSLLNPNFVIKEYKKKINLKENRSLFYLESIFSYIFNANLKNLQNLLSLDKTRIVQNYILNFYYNHF